MVEAVVVMTTVMTMTMMRTYVSWGTLGQWGEVQSSGEGTRLGYVGCKSPRKVEVQAPPGIHSPTENPLL